MLTLLIDTCTERGILAFAQAGSLIYQAELPFGLQNSKHLIPAMQAGLAQERLDLNQFALIVVGIGPGSYTGIRVGVAVAKTIAYASSIPIVGISTLEGFVPHEDGVFFSMIDAKQGGVYLMAGEKKNGTIARLAKPAVHPLEQAKQLCSGAKWIVTPNSDPLRQRWSTEETPWVERYPDPQLMIHLAEERMKNGEESTPFSLDLLYLKEWTAQ